MYRPIVLMQATKLLNVGLMQENRIIENCSQLHTVILVKLIDSCVLRELLGARLLVKST